MANSKRKRPQQYEDSDIPMSADSADGLEGESDAVASEAEVDIFSALAGNKTKASRSSGRNVPLVNGDDDAASIGDDDEELQAFIHDATVKRDKKAGTQLLKKTKGSNKIAKGEVGGGSFQSMGLHPSLLRSLTLRGYRTPTPIQRLSIPVLLASPPRDLVGMARTGSGKTLAYMVPLIQRLGGRHKTTFGVRAIILVPSRELALQVFKVGKELVRGWHAGEGDHAGDADADDAADGKKGQGLRWGLVVGGESLDEQFEMIASNPDVIIATPGRLLHLAVEMSLDLRAVQYVVFDEADRLFELGFATALDEILHRLPSSRQTLLFSATLPKSLVEFAKAGLQNPKLVRLDAESKLSTDLQMAFFSVKQAEKEACLLVLLRDIIGVPLGEPSADENKEDLQDKVRGKGKGKGKAVDGHHREAAPHQTVIFAATKHHIEYLSNLLSTAGYSVSHIYGSLDQAARTAQMDRFRRGRSSILVVTDVAARGIDIPVLENVVNYDFPHGSRVFVHRVGRTARAGRKGWAYSFVCNTDLPHLLDLQLFLARPFKHTVEGSGGGEYTNNLVLGPFSRDRIDDEIEYMRTLDAENTALPTLREVMRKGHSMYERSQGKASQASYKRSKEIAKSTLWGFAASAVEAKVHPIFLSLERSTTVNPGTDANKEKEEADARAKLLSAVNAFTPSETVFEIGTRGKTPGAAIMKERRKALVKARERGSGAVTNEQHDNDTATAAGPSTLADVEMAREEDLLDAFDSGATSSSKKSKYRDSEFYIDYVQKDANTEKGYSLREGASFAEQAQGVTFDLTGDEALAERQRRYSQLRWDRKKKKFVKGDGAGADNMKMVKTESGAKLPATYRSGRYDEWRAKSKVEVPKVGEAESERARAFGGRKGKPFVHKSVTAAKPLDKLRGDYERKLKKLKKDDGGEGEAKEGPAGKPGKHSKKGAPSRRYGGKPMQRVRTELKTVDQIRKNRELAAKRKAKNARPTHKGRGKR